MATKKKVATDIFIMAWLWQLEVVLFLKGIPQDELSWLNYPQSFVNNWFAGSQSSL